MSHIQGVKKPLLHANSFTGERLPKYGVETIHEEELGKVTFVAQYLFSVLCCAWHCGYLLEYILCGCMDMCLLVFSVFLGTDIFRIEKRHNKLVSPSPEGSVH